VLNALGEADYASGQDGMGSAGGGRSGMLLIGLGGCGG
jgi:hypothetical protein